MRDGCLMVLQRKWTIKQQAAFLNRLGLLLERGYSLSEAITFLALHMQIHVRQQQQLQKTIDKLKNGESFSEVLEDLCFHPTSISYAYYGENNGNLSQTLQTAGQILFKQALESAKIMKLLTYPIFLLVFTGLMFTLMQWILFPQFAEMYHSFQTKPGGLMEWMLWVNQHQWQLFIVITMFILMILLGISIWKRKNSQYEIQIVLCQLPFVGPIYKLINTYYISYQMSMLLTNGASLMDCLQFLKKDPKKQYLQDAMKLIDSDLLAGEQLAEAMVKIPLWQKELTSVIRHGQQSGRMDIELSTYSETCYGLVSDKIEKMTQILQPFLFSMIGIWIVIMYISIMLPSFQMINNL